MHYLELYRINPQEHDAFFRKTIYVNVLKLGCMVLAWFEYQVVFLVSKEIPPEVKGGNRIHFLFMCAGISVQH